MNVALRTAMTVEQFLKWEERQEQRHKFDGHQPVAVAGGTAAPRSRAAPPWLPTRPMLRLPEAGLDIPRAEFYLGVTLDAPGNAPA